MDRAVADQRARATAVDLAVTAGAGDFINRLRKNLRHLRRWADREGVSCYRLYDADLPEYAVAVDRYAQWLHVQEYAPPPTVDPDRARERLEQVLAVLPAVLEVPPDRVFLKVRQRQRGARQYQKQADQGHFHEVREGPARFLVNFTDYLDTGLFLDHRITRRRLGERAGGRRFLNLFGYTGTATVYAALGGAISTTTVDLSATYLDWARRNLELNGIRGPQHQLIQADCRQWLIWARGHYDLIFLDPPTFSNSRRLEEVSTYSGTMSNCCGKFCGCSHRTACWCFPPTTASSGSIAAPWPICGSRTGAGTPCRPTSPAIRKSTNAGLWGLKAKGYQRSYNFNGNVRRPRPLGRRGAGGLT